MTAVLLLVAMTTTTSVDLQSILDRFLSEQDIPGVSAVVTHKNQQIFAGASGFADLETGRAMTPDTVLYAGSLTKIFTAVLTLQLAEEGKLSLDDNVAGIAEAANASQGAVSVIHLLTHTSGLDREGNFGYWFNAKFPDTPALEHYLRTADLRATPGKEVRYSNVGFAALAKVIENAGGESYSDALRHRLLQPLRMLASGAPGPGPEVAVGYTPVDRIIPSEEKPFAGVGRQVGRRYVREYHDAKAMTPAFGAYTSARDMGRLGRLLLGYGSHGVLSDESREKMLRAQTSGWGMGIKIGRQNGRAVARHSGWFAAHRSHLLLDLDSEIAVVVLTNSDGAASDRIAEALITQAVAQWVDRQSNPNGQESLE